MAIKKPLVIGTGDLLAEELSSGDTLSTADIADSTNKRFVTDEEKAAIGAAAGDQVNIQDTEPTANGLWIQTNVGGNPDDFMVWIKE